MTSPGRNFVDGSDRGFLTADAVRFGQGGESEFVVLGQRKVIAMPLKVSKWYQPDLPPPTGARIRTLRGVW